MATMEASSGTDRTTSTQWLYINKSQLLWEGSHSNNSPTTNHQEDLSSKMCFHKRIVFLCSHFGWADEIRACDTQKSFLNGSKKVECETMWSHPLHSIKAQKNCKVCAAKQEKTDATVSTLKERLRALSETVARLQRTEDAEEKEEEKEIDLDAEADAEAFPCVAPAPAS
jgi:hypothetical protein